mmetsp:Transcript_70725/g.169412  ORF Transcript_70725/g.169412 Transcript_70725/m.169412 type:complete len:119 (+) Transcript_70725:3-359(+)
MLAAARVEVGAARRAREAADARMLEEVAAMLAAAQVEAAKIVAAAQEERLAAHVAAQAAGLDNECVICLEGEKTHAVIPCGHLALCGGCAALISYSQVACPVCMVPASAPFTVKVFRT